MGTGHTPSRSHPEYWEDCTIPWLTLADVHQLRDGRRAVVESTSEKISELGVQHSSAVPHPAGTVAMSRTASVGFSCIMGSTMATSQDFVTWTCGSKLDNRFLLWAIRGERAQILSRMQGSTHKTIYMPDLEDLRLFLPPLAEQRAIADYLDVETARIDALIAKKQQLIHLLEERWVAHRESLLWCDAVPVPLHRLTDPMRPIVYGIVQAGPEVDGGVPYIKTGDLSKLGEPSKLSRTSDLIDRQYSRSRVEPGDIVVAMRASIGDAVLVPPALERANLTQGTARVASQEGVDARWLLHAFRSTSTQEQCDLRAVGSTFRTLNIWDLRRVEVPMPNDRCFGLLVARLDDAQAGVRNTTERLTRQISLLAERRQALITAAVTGEFVVPGAP